MLKNNFRKICVVGIGKHAYVNLIPSLKKKNFKIVGLVTRTPKSYNRNYKRFSNIDLALKKLPKDTIYIISTPPKTHFKILSKLLANNRNVLVEKPLVTSKYEIEKLKSSLYLKKFFYEMFMYKFTNCYVKAINICKKNFKDVKSIEFTFLLPSYPHNTFRNSKYLEDSCLFDIGSYIFDLSMDIGNKIENVKLINCFFEGKKLRRLQFSFEIKGIKCKSDIGLDFEYQNWIKITKTNQNHILFDKIFYGKKAYKNITFSNFERNISYFDVNGYEEMFNKVNFKKIVKNKLVNYNNLKEIYKNLDDLRKKIEDY